MNPTTPSSDDKIHIEKFQNVSDIAGQDVSDNDGLEKTPVQDATSEEEHIYPKGLPLALTLTSSALAMFLMALDRTIIATAIPTITNEFNSLGDIGWYATTYMITNCAFQLMFGKIYKFYSTKWVFLVAFSIFEIGSAICGAAPNSAALIVGRAIAGLGASGVVSGSMMILVYTTPLHKRPMYAAIFAATVGVASILGPVLGGVLTSKVSWRWCFYINLPIGAFTVPVIIFCLKTPSPDKSKQTLLEQLAKLDPLGALCFVPSIICLVLALQWGGTTYAWSDRRVVACLVIFIVFMLAFIALQIWSGDKATVPPRIIKQRSIASGAWLQFCGAGSTYILAYYLPLWFQAVKGVSAVQSGVRILPTVVTMIIGAFAGGLITKKSGHYVPAVIISAVVAPIGLGLITMFHPNTGHKKWIGYQVIYGMGQGTSMQVAPLVAQAVLDKADVSIGTAVMFFSQQLGSIVFVAVSQNVFLDRLLKNLSGISGLDASITLETGATDLRSIVPVDDLTAVVEAYNGAVVKTFDIATVCACLVVLSAVTLEWKSIKKREVEKPTT
ncbi:related to transporter (major facilitator superfamily) [Phialocephala subalpina]|uniref:Related to transporter (Major facilitator superfamily) n=1 Tax=Phialocephala subalpina TaxID=576137 RepID=A0A1L7WPD2_9HELO|nr:related to transporter (major facilitator superfamily) [Phialocephala subalpina]